MAIKNGDFVRVNYVGRVKDDGEVFETTYEEIAKEEGIFDKNIRYVPIPIVVGGNHLLPDLEKSIIGLDVGDSKTVDIESENAFGPRNPDLVQLYSIKEFKKQGIKPYKGMKITSNGAEGKVLTVNGGRVKVDFNHSLAGRDVVYDVEVDGLIEGIDEQIKGMIELHYSNPSVDLDKTEISIEDGVATISLEESARFDQKSYMDITLTRFRISRDIWENIDGIDSVNFVDKFSPNEFSSDESGEEE